MATQSPTELAPQPNVTPFVAALRAANPGASQPQPPEPQPEPEVAAEDVAEVAADAPEQVARKDDASEPLPDLSQVPGFKEWQSSMDKQIAALKKEKEQVEAKKAVGPPPELVQKRTELLNQYQLLEQQAQAARSQGNTDDYIAWEVEKGKHTDKLLDLDFQIAATTYGLDPADADLRSRLDAQYAAGEITNEKELKAFMADQAFQQGVTPEKMATMAEREKELVKREAAIEDTIKAAVNQQLAQILQQNGLTGIPSTKPAGAKGPKQELEAQYVQAVQSRNMRAALSIQRQLLELES